MIHEVMNLLSDKLNSYIKLKSGINEDKVRFLDGANFDPIQFPLDFITPIIVNIREERILRQNGYYEPKNSKGIKIENNPEINIELIVLFVSRFKQYDQGLKFLSMMLSFFQANRYIDRMIAPEMSEEVDRLSIELMNMSVSEQNEIWNALRVGYLPSVAFKIGMFTYKDQETLAQASEMDGIQINTKRI